ncbi:SDR family NAD(P)-dependent oxidoreductase [Halobacterium litoreum]|uniref:SDR family NAD(P)-dependent oxidoreductase n=1 Tax=Halobacterium litoreum TaxID=2039234 RepID=A0ABD5NAZ5_9EURY|nr:SDR family NAD(P)-dependent oxidoreductase [Halobacterium litoreum]UHH11998.1 SDR family oxidoreductase [Halobacterium litoreum]
MSVEPPTLEREDVHEIADERFTGESVALVTGAASGIGRATALALAVNGVTVAALDVDEDGLAETVADADDLGAEGDVHATPADLTDDDEVIAAVEAAAELGDLRWVANVAGLQHVAPLEEFPMDVYDTMQAVMVRAPTLIAKHALPHIRASGGGAVGNMASVHGHYVTSDKVAYNVAKFGLRGLTQSIAAEGDGDVRSFSVSTGYVKTPLVVDQIPDTAEERGISEREVVEDVMLGQSRATEMMEPVDVANLFVLGFSELGSHLNGGDLRFDDGMTLTYE